MIEERYSRTTRDRAISALVELLESTEDESTRMSAASILGEIDPGNQTAIAALVKLLKSTKKESTRRVAASILGKIGTGNQTAISIVVDIAEGVVNVSSDTVPKNPVRCHSRRADEWINLLR